MIRYYWADSLKLRFLAGDGDDDHDRETGAELACRIAAHEMDRAGGELADIDCWPIPVYVVGDDETNEYDVAMTYDADGNPKFTASTFAVVTAADEQ